MDFWINSGFCRISGDCVSELNITFFGFINITIYTLFIYISYSSLRTFRILISKHPHWGTWYLLIRPKTLSPYGGVLYICVFLTCMLLFSSTSCTKRWKYIYLVNDVEEANYKTCKKTYFKKIYNVKRMSDNIGNIDKYIIYKILTISNYLICIRFARNKRLTKLWLHM